MYFAVQGGRLDMVKYLVTVGKAKIDIENDNSLLYTASLNGFIDILDYLITICGENPNCIIENNSTLLVLAC